MQCRQARDICAALVAGAPPPVGSGADRRDNGPLDYVAELDLGERGWMGVEPWRLRDVIIGWMHISHLGFRVEPGQDKREVEPCRGLIGRRGGAVT